MKNCPLKNCNGFTLVEVSLVLAIFTILISLTTVNFIRPTKEANFSKIKEELLATIREAQGKSIAGFSTNGTSGENFGIHFEQNSYTLFRGTTFVETDTWNFKITLPTNLEFPVIGLPTPDLVFGKGSGEIVNFNPTQNQVTLRDKETGNLRNFIFNFFGVVNVQ